MFGANLASGRPSRLLWAAAALLCLAAPGLPAAAGGAVPGRGEADALFTNGTLLRLALDIPERGLDSLRRDPRQYVAATLREGNTLYSNVAVHLKGSVGSFRQLDDRPGLTLHFTHLEPGGPRFHGLKKVHLNNAAQDPSRLSELVAGQMFREAGVPAARAAHALLEFNGRKLGLYVIVEAMNTDFLSQYFRNPRGNLYGQSRRCDVSDAIERMEGDEPLTREDLAALAGAVTEKDAARRLELLQRTLDLDRFLSFMALETILCHWDGYTMARHNYRVYHDLDTGRMVFFPHDLDQLMARQNVGLVPRAGGLVALAVLNTDALRARYMQRVSSLATNLFLAPRWTQRVDRAVAALLPGLESSDADLARSFTSQAAALKTRIVNRALRLEWPLAILNGTASPLRFSNDLGCLPKWYAESWRGGTRVERTKDAEGKSSLWISATRAAVASWRTQVLLDPGRYRFEGLAHCAGVEILPRRKGGGAALAVSASRQYASGLLKGDAAWQKLSCEFEVAAREEVELACELRAQKGEVWFEESSLQLVRLK
jgi:spore coat protein H